jgi:hypothetical protein
MRAHYSLAQRMKCVLIAAVTHKASIIKLIQRFIIATTLWRGTIVNRAAPPEAAMGMWGTKIMSEFMHNGAVDAERGYIMQPARVCNTARLGHILCKEISTLVERNIHRGGTPEKDPRRSYRKSVAFSGQRYQKG